MEFIQTVFDGNFRTYIVLIIPLKAIKQVKMPIYQLQILQMAALELNNALTKI